MSASKLVRPDIAYKDSFLEALDEYYQEGRYHYLKKLDLNEGFDKFVGNLNIELDHHYETFQEWVNIVPETVAWLVKDDAYIGTIEIRHRLNWHLEKWGGHIHFIIRPSRRRQSFGKRILLKAIPIANYLGIEKALLTVDPANQAAIRTVESCGAVLEDELPTTDQFPARRRYWLDCT